MQIVYTNYVNLFLYINNTIFHLIIKINKFVICILFNIILNLHNLYKLHNFC